MPANINPVFELAPRVSAASFALADSTNKKTLLTAGANGTRVDSLFLSSNDTVQVDVAFYINDGATDFYIGDVQVPIGSGYTGVPRVEALKYLGEYLIGALVLPANYVLKCNCVAAVTSGKILTVVVAG